MPSIKDVKPQEEYVFEIPKEIDFKFRIISDYEFLGRHWDGSTYIPCVGAKNNCPFCETGDKPTNRCICYIMDANGQVILAGLAYTIFQELKKLYDQFPTEFSENAQGEIIPNFFIKVFRSGSGINTRYNVEKDLPVNDLVDLSGRQPVADYVKLQKAEVKDRLNPASVPVNPTAQAETVELNNEPPAPMPPTPEEENVGGSVAPF